MELLRLLLFLFVVLFLFFFLFLLLFLLLLLFLFFFFLFLLFNICFVAEAAVELSPRGGGGIVQHIFQLDLDQLKIEAKKILSEEEVKNLIIPDAIAAILEEKYCDFTEFLVDYNGEKDNYCEIARLIKQYRGTAGAKIFHV